MPPTKYQENSSLCFAMSSMQLLNHLQCTATARCDFGDPYEGGGDEFSIRDAVSAYYADSAAEEFGTGGLPGELLNIVLSKGKLAPEKCAPFSQFASLSLNNQGVNIYDLLRDLYAKFKISNQTAPCFISDQFPNLENQSLVLQHFMIDAQNALESQNEQEFLRKVTLPPKCEAQRRDLPRFSVQKFTSTNAKEIREKINSLIDQGIPLSFLHNIYRRLPSDDPKVFFGSHAANIAGKREQCCLGKCELQYLILDSSGVTPNERWEAAAVVIRSILDLSEIDAFSRPDQQANLSPQNYPAVLKPVIEKMHESLHREPTRSELSFLIEHLTAPNGEALVWIVPAI